MASSNPSIPLNSTTTPALARGWVNQPDGRGTLDILQSCILTIFLCSWSVLCLNIPKKAKTRRGILLVKLRWVAFTIFFPEVLTALAEDQYSSASQSVSDFQRLAYPQWTMRHAFFADMGGFILEPPDFPPFPVDAQQLHYLVANHYLPFPDADERVIWNANKGDGFARFVTILQIAWFGIQCLGRAFQHLPMSSFELSTLAFVFCTIPTFFFWRHKPLDADATITLRMESRIADILIQAKESASKPYDLTPLDFVRPRPQTGLLTPFWLSLRRLFGSGKGGSARPIQTFQNTKRVPPRGLKPIEVTVGALIGLGYTGIHLAGWNFHFPLALEQMLWRIASAALVGIVLVYLIFIGIGTLIARVVARKFFDTEARTCLELLTLLPPSIQIPLFSAAVVGYGSARFYIFMEAFVSLRALPVGAYASVNWSNFIPHL